MPCASTQRLAANTDEHEHSPMPRSNTTRSYPPRAQSTPEIISACSDGISPGDLLLLRVHADPLWGRLGGLPVPDHPGMSPADDKRFGFVRGFFDRGEGFGVHSW
jgi:hypothetical protein